tara:strand:+ start:829 stop:1731 length:903 start_codon:yes stop_codon:yes gene_type:complete
MKQTILLIIFILLPSVLKSQSQSAILKGQDTVVVFPSAESGVFQVEILTGLIPEELHSLTNKYSEYDYSFKDEEDLRSTMSSYLNDGYVVVNWRLTKNEKSLLKKYKKRELEDWKKNESLTTRREVDNAKTTIGLDNNNSTTSGNGQQYKPKALEDLRLSVNASVMPSELTTSIGGSAYINYKKFLVGYTLVEGSTGRQRTQSGNIVTTTDVTIRLNSGSIGYEVSPDLFLKGGFGINYVGGSVSVGSIGISSSTERFNDWIETPSFGVLYMNRTYHFNFGVDLVGASDPLMLFSLGFNL